MNRIYIPAQSPDDWKTLLADPDKHWNEGRSAWCIAHCWQNVRGFPPEVNDAFQSSGIAALENMELLLATPEHKVALPGGGHPSQNDLFILARGGEGLISITVEGKVNETSGPLVSEWFQDPSEGKKQRLEFLCELLGLERSKVMSIRYQLLHRTASAILEARRFNAPHALMLVHSFSADNAGFVDYAAFAALYGARPELPGILQAGKIGGVVLHLGWVTATPPYSVQQTCGKPIQGVVTARKCEHCGHHEIGITDSDGKYWPLSPGQTVDVRPA
ncbi:DUF6946 family protein [Thermodesulfobacteriota bacterium]